MASRPTLADIAREAGVGPATVDRVVNARGTVRPETARRVLEAARAIGYHGTPLIRRRVEDAVPHYRVGFLLLRRQTLFYRDLAAGLASVCAAAPGARLQPEFAFLMSQNPLEIVAELKAMARKVEAIAVVAIDHPTVSATVAEITATGIPVFTLLSDAAPDSRRAYLGLDNRKAGRTAGWVMARSVRGPGKVAIFVGSHRFHGHEMREIGYRSYLREAAPELEIIDTQMSLEDESLAYEAVLDLVGRHPDLRGIYIAGGGTEGAVAALREESEAGAIALVCNEINELTRAGLAEGYISAVISTPIAALARAAVEQMIGALAAPGGQPAAPTYLPFDIFVSENI